MRNNRTISFQYTNYRGENSHRTVRPLSFRWGTSEWHHAPQWLMLAFDIDKGEEREFATKDMSEVKTGEPFLLQGDVTP